MRYILLTSLCHGTLATAPFSSLIRAVRTALGHTEESEMYSEIVLADEATWTSVPSVEASGELMLVDYPQSPPEILDETPVSSLSSPVLSAIAGAIDVDERMLQTIRELELSDVAEWQYAPQLSLNGPLLTQATPLAVFALAEAIAHTETSAVFRLFPRNDLVIKYQMDCFENETTLDGGRVHPLVVEFHYLRLIQDLNIAPRIYFISPISDLPPPPGLGGRMQLNLSAADYAECLGKNSRVRYVVMDRVGMSVFHYQRRYIGGRVPFYNAIHIGIEMMNALQLIHDQGGIQHNDCHHGNFVLDQHLRIKLIDFGRASYVENIAEGDEINPNAYGDNNPLLTPWEMEGLRPTRRDDVYRAIFAVAGMMNGSEFYSLFRRFNHLGAETFEVKSRRNFMLGAFGRTLFNQVKVRNPELVTAFLNQIVDLVMGTAMNERPPYEAIRAILSQILDTRTMI